MIVEHYDSKLPLLLGADAVTLGEHVFYKYRKQATPDWLRRHEWEHVKQYRKFGFFRFLYRYLKEYFSYRLKGFTKYDAYSMISYEKEATQAEGENTHGK